MREVIITWCTGFNGFSLNFDGGMTDEEEKKYCNAFENVSEALPELGYDIIGGDTWEAINEGDEDPEVVEDMVGSEDEEKIFATAREILKDSLDEEFTFKLEYNTTDS